MRFNSDVSTFFKTIFQLVLLAVLIMWGMRVIENPVPDNWEQQIGYMALVLLSNQVICLWSCGCRFAGFEMWLVIFFYLFMLGQVLLKGVFGVDEIESTGYIRTLMDPRYSEPLMYKSAVFILCCIQAVVCGLVRKPQKVQRIDSTNVSVRLYKTGMLLMLIAAPSHLYYSLRMIMQAQSGASYEAIVDTSGLVDDIANFFVPAMLCIIFSNKINKTTMKAVITGVVIYLAVIMVMTGDRRYQTVTMIVLVLAYMHNYNIRLSIKQLWLLVPIVILLNGFMILRNIRGEELTDINQFFNKYSNELFSLDNNIFYQTLYEFGSSFYTVCLAFRYIPSRLEYRLGATLFSGSLSVIPLGYMYQNMDMYIYGRIATMLMNLGKTTVGGSMIADVYGNFGWIGGIIFSYITGLFFKFILKIKDKSKNIELKLVKYYTVFYACIHLVRASFTEVIRTVVWGIGVVYFVYFLIIKEEKE